MNELKGIVTHITESFQGSNEWFYPPCGQDWTWGALVGDWEPLKAAIEQHAPEKRVIITAGAHCGLYAYGYAGGFRTVYAFEPDPVHFYCLVNNVQFHNVIKIQAGLGETPSFGSMVGASVSATVSEDVNAGPFIPVLPLDGFNFPVVDVIQLDIEGYELRALKGAIQTITAHHPLLILENGHLQEIVDFLTPLGYTCTNRLAWDSVWVYKGESSDTKI